MVRREIKTYEEAVEYLLHIPRFTTKNSMEDTKAFLRRLGNPDKSFRIIHVAGTNGKGSVCAYMRMMLEEAGLSTCVFTSPHLVDVRERFLIKGKMVEKEAFLKSFLHVYDEIPWEMIPQEDAFNETGGLPEGFYHPTFFEYLFFMAMLLFKEAKPDFCILETGLGGRLDATNSVTHKELAVITRISLDHVEYLGDTPEKIAAEKAGIIAQGSPVVYLGTTNSVNAVFDETARKIGASECIMSKTDNAFTKMHDKNIDFSLHTRYYNDIEIHIPTLALYQVENASLAVRAIETLDRGERITAKQIQAALAKCFWPGRMEEIEKDVFVDGAHNADGVRAFLESVKADQWEGERVLLFSAVKDKAFEKMLGEIVDSGLFAEIDLVPLQSSRATSVQVLSELTQRLLQKKYSAEKNLEEKDSKEKDSKEKDSKEKDSKEKDSKEKELEENLEEKNSDEADYNEKSSRKHNVKEENGNTEEKPRSVVYHHVDEALGYLIKGKREDQRIYIAGSLYLVGEVLACYAELAQKN